MSYILNNKGETAATPRRRLRCIYPCVVGEAADGQGTKTKNKGKDKETDIVRQDKKNKVVRSVGVNIYICVSPTQEKSK